MQASPIGMASASQADFGEFDSRRLLQKLCYCCLLCCYCTRGGNFYTPKRVVINYSDFGAK